MKNPICIVEWEDASTYSNKDLEDIRNDEPSIVKTFGILYKTKNHFIVMTHTCDLEDSSDFIKIPKSLVRRVIKLKEGK